MAMSYAESAAREQLNIATQQFKQNTLIDSRLAQKAKQNKRKDFEQQIQPLYTQVEFKGGELFSPAPSGGLWGKKKTTKGGGVPSAVTGPPTPGVAWGEGQVSRGPSGIRGITGGMNVVSPAAQWTTEGYMETGPQVQSTLSMQIDQSKKKLKNKAMKIEPLVFPGVVGN